ncbi:MAG: hypothetical protein AAF747_02295 [Planctomycetota bacterium]
MLLTLTLNASAPVFAAKAADLDLPSVPARVREELGIHGLNLATDLLVGATRESLTAIRDASDKAGCACLLLVEREPLLLASAKLDEAKAAADRAQRVLAAASLLGCNSVALYIAGDNDEATRDRAAESLKPVVEQAERLEINALIGQGLPKGKKAARTLTSDPDELTALLKAVGGFRIGTFPDFQVAAASDDPELYVKRLTPYASAVTAATLEFGDPPPPPERKERKPKKAAAEEASKADEAPEAEAEKQADDADVEEIAAEAAKAAGENGAGGGASTLLAALGGAGAGEANKGGDESAGDDELDGLDLDKLMAALDDFDDEDEPDPIAPHIAYDLQPLVRAVVAVGYDGSLALEYRGKGDAKLNISRSRDAIEAALEQVGQE